MSHPVSTAARACVLALLAALTAAAPAHAAFTLGKLRADSATGPENYAFTAGDTFVPEGSVDSGKWHRFVVTDAAGVVRNQTACTASPAGGSITGESAYTVPGAAPPSNATGWRYQLQQFSTAACSGAPAKTAALYFTVARLTAYTSAALSTPTTAIAPGATAYIRVDGLGKVKTSAAVGAETDWLATWLTPSGGTACANTGGGDRPNSTVAGVLPDIAGSFLQYRPNSPDAGDQWNFESKYETRPCADTSAHGEWRLKLQKDATHFVTLDAFLVTVLTPVSLDAAPASPGGERHPAWWFSGGGGLGHECRLRLGSAVISDWSPCASPRSYDLTGEPEGDYEFSVRAVAGAEIGPPTVSSYLLDTTPPAAPSIDSGPSPTGLEPSPAWSFSAEVGTSIECRLDGPAGLVSDWAPCADSAAYDLSAEADGTYTFSVRARDAAGLTSPAATAAYLLDRAGPPPPTIASHPLAADNDANPAWGFSAEPGAAVECRLDRGIIVISDWTVCTSPASYDLSGQIDGTYTFSARAIDAVGNVGAPVISTYVLDRAAPAAPSFTTAPASPGHDAAAQWAFSGEAGATYDCRLQRDGSTVDDWAPCASPDLPTLTTDGAYVLSVRATDAAGNTGAAASSTYVLDRVGPAAPAFTSTPSSPDHDPTVAWGFSGEAGAAFACRVDRGGTQIAGWAPCSSPDDVDLTAQSDGTYTFSVRATDAAGNTGAVATSDYALDRSAPAAPAITAHPLAADNDPHPSWTAAGDPATALQCRLERGLTVVSDWTVCTGPTAYDLSGEPDGTYTFAARSVDDAGNIGAPTTWTYVLDRVAPAAPVITNAPASPGPDATVAWSFTGEAGAGFSCRVDRGGSTIVDWAPCSSPDDVDLTAAGDGTYTFSVEATDAAGNTSAVATSTYVLDQSAPAAATITSSPQSPGNDPTVAWGFSGEAGATFDCRVDRGATQISGWAPCSSPDPVDLTAAGDGTYTFSVRASDGAGNSGTPATSTYVLDTTDPAAPVITDHPLPADADPTPTWSLTTDPGTALHCRLERGVTVVSDWSVCTSPAGFDLTGESDGTYTFTARAVDAAGNASAETAATYVLDRTAPGAPSFTSAPTSPGQATGVQWAFSGEPGAAYECRLQRDGSTVDDWSPCASPGSRTLTADGSYVLSVRATDAAGNTGAPATSTYVLDRVAPAAPALTTMPTSPDHDPTVAWGFTGEAGATFDCRADRGSTPVADWAPCSSPDDVDLTAQSDGTYTFSVRATDAAGNTGLTTTADYDLDRTAPSAPAITAHPLADDNDATPTWTAAGDPGTALQCRLERGITVVSDWTTCTGPATYDLAAEPDGAYTFSVRAIDASGNVGAATTSGYRLDRVAPAAPSITAAPASPDLAVHPQWSFTGEAGATFNCRLQRNGAVVGDWASCTSPDTPDLSAEPDGTYAFSVRATDAAGNAGAATTATYELDRTGPDPPLIDVAPPASGASTTPVWEVSASDPADTLECRTERGATLLSDWAACSSPHGEDLSALGDATYTVSFRARDAAGNVGPAASSTYTLDTTAPGGPDILTHPASPGHDAAPAWSFSGDAGTTFQCRLSRGGATVADWSACTSPRAYDLSAEADGAYTFSVRAVDGAGNDSAAATSSYELDRAAPGAPSIASGPASPGTDAAPTWSYGAEAGATAECRLERGAVVVAGWAACASSRTYSLSGQPDGPYTFSVRAIDAAGNTGPAATSSYTVDRTGPNAPVIATGPPALASTVRPAWSFAGEAGSSLTCRLVREAIVVAEWAPCAGSREYDLSGQPDGTYTLAVRATDALGNVGAAASAAYVLDTTASAAPQLDAAPRSPGTDRAPSWSFSGTPGDTFECRLDRGPTLVADWAACSSPQRYDLAGAPDAGYTFIVRAIDAAGNVSGVAAAVYDLDTTPPGAVTLTAVPAPRDRDRRPEWAFTGQGGTFECRLARLGAATGDWAACTSPRVVDLRGQPDGEYTLAVREQDAAGNRGPGVSSRYRLDTEAPDAPTVTATDSRREDARRLVTLSFSAEDAADTECRLRLGTTLVSDWAECTSPRTYDVTAYGDGDYEFSVRATDAAGNTSPVRHEDYTFTSPSSAPTGDGAPADAPGPAPAGVPASEPAAARPPARRSPAGAAASAGGPRARGAGSASGGTAGPRRQPRAERPSAVDRRARPGTAGAARARAAAPSAPRTAGQRAVHAIAAVATAAAHKARQVARVAARNADKSVFPGSLIFIVIGFLGVQNRIDRSDPKLALAQLGADQEVVFGPPPSRR